MVRCYKRKTSNEGKYSAADLNTAMSNVLSGRTSIYKAAKLYKKTYVTLHSRVKGKRGAKKATKGRPTSISAADEVRLANGLKTMEKWGYGLSRKEVLEIVGNFVKTNHIETNFKDGVPGEDCFLGFKRRHRLSMKVPQNVEYGRKKVLDHYIIYQYFDLLKSIMDEHGLHDKPERIWNLDESSLCIDPRKTKVMGDINAPSSRTISSPGKENTTIALMCSAAGQKAPPLIIHKGLHLWDQWIAPPRTDFEGTVYAATKKGWMEKAVFKNHFINTIISSLPSGRLILIIYDGHSTHMNIETLEAAVREQIIILKLPPHSSHILQSLDLAVFKYFKVKWDEKLVA
ncbi:uncharacterized protein [Leptinotarsa decemlineata]|uniref:uncharacterized protein n=1 Tax=Leptinotarsa decemlineata TaxID=7539 RepID=UPI003D30A444